MSIQQSIVVSVLAISLVGCGSKASDPGFGGATQSQASAPASATSGGAVPPALRTAIATTLKVDESKVTPTASFAKDLGANEISMVELVMAYEREFKIDIADSDADRFHQVQDVVGYLQRLNVLR